MRFEWQLTCHWGATCRHRSRSGSGRWGRGRPAAGWGRIVIVSYTVRTWRYVVSCPCDECYELCIESYVAEEQSSLPHFVALVLYRMLCSVNSVMYANKSRILSSTLLVNLLEHCFVQNIELSMRGVMYPGENATAPMFPWLLHTKVVWVRCCSSYR